MCWAGSYDHFLNFQIGFIIVLQLAMCVFCAVASYVWRQRAGFPRYQLAFDQYVQVRRPGVFFAFFGAKCLVLLRCPHAPYARWHKAL